VSGELEYIVRIKRAEQPWHVFAQRVFEAVAPNAAECAACAWAYEQYGGHPEQYDARAVLLAQWEVFSEQVFDRAWQ